MEDQINEEIIQDREILEMDSIFEKISNKYKDKNDEYLLKKVLDAKLDNYIGHEKISEEIENGAFFSFDYPFCYLEKDKKTIPIKFLVKARFLDSKNKKRFSFWVCSFDYLKEKLQSMGYKQAKIENNKLFVKHKENKDKGSRSSSSESLQNSNDIDIKLKEKEVNVSQNIFSLENIFDKSQETFNPTVSFENIEDYEKDIKIPETKNKDKLKFNKNYTTDLREIMEKENGLYCYFYNEKSGLTLNLLQILEKKKKLFNTRYFYFNSEYINKYKKKYFYFRIAKMFQKDEKELFLKLLNPEQGESIKYNSSYLSKILNKILKQLKDVHIIFDNIRDISIFYKIMKIIAEMNQNIEYIEKEKGKEKDDKEKKDDKRNIEIETNKIRLLNNYIVSLFLPINNINLEIIDSSIIYQSNISSLFPSDNACTQELTPTEYINSLVLDNFDAKEYKQNIKEKISKFIDNNNIIEYLIFLIEIVHLKPLIKNKNLLYNKNNTYLIKFLPYIYVSLKIENNSIFINKIKFRTNFIEEIINDQINFLLSKNIIIDDIFKYIRTKSTEGIYIEKEIIYYLITRDINFEKVKIEKIYCFNSSLDEEIKTFIKNKNRIIFIQKSESAPLYDFGVIIYINEKPIFKGYQIGINKPLSSLGQLYIEKVRIDSLYFINKINKFLDEKITEFSFGIITTKYAYDNQTKNNIINNDNNFNDELEIDNYEDINNDKKEDEKDNEYKNYNIMKKFCNDNKYEFLIFDPNNNKFFIDKNENLEIIDFHDYYDKSLMNTVANYICRNEDNYHLTKLPINPNEITKTDREYISNSINAIAKDKQLNLIGKFEKDISTEIDFDLINDNYLIYSNFKKEKVIYFKEKFFGDDSKDLNIIYSSIFYIFDTSLKKAKKGRKKKNMDLNNNITLFSNKDKDNSNENNEENENLLKKKRKKDDEENSDDEQDNKDNKKKKSN